MEYDRVQNKRELIYIPLKLRTIKASATQYGRYSTVRFYDVTIRAYYLILHQTSNR